MGIELNARNTKFEFVPIDMVKTCQRYRQLARFQLRPGHEATRRNSPRTQVEQKEPAPRQGTLAIHLHAR